MDHDLPPELAPRRDELLARVTKRGRALRARRLGVLTTMLVLAVGVPIAAFAVVSDGGDNPKVAAVAPTTNVSAETPTTLTPGSRAAIDVLSVTPGEPTVGEPVTFVIRTDANCDVNTDFGDERVVTASSCRLVCASGPAFTSTTKPDAGFSKSYTHVYSVPGDYTATFTAQSGTCEGGSSIVSASVSVHVVDRHVLTTDPKSAGPPDTTAPNATVPQTTVPVCRNSTNPACGPFHYDPAPSPNQAMTVTVGHDHPDTFRVGEPVRFTIAASDPDSRPPGDASGCEVGVQWGDGTGKGVCVPACARPGYGPWDPPARIGGDATYAMTHTYDAPGGYVVEVSVASDLCSPYGDLGRGSVTVHVVP